MNGIGYYKESPDALEIKICSNGVHACKEHLHKELSIGYIEKGISQLYVNGVEHYIKAGEAIMIYPYVSHKCQPLDVNQWAFTMIYIPRELCGKIYSRLGAQNAIGIKPLDAVELRQIKRLVEASKREAPASAKGGELLYRLTRLFKQEDIAAAFEGNQRIEAVKAYIEGHFLEELSLDELEEKFDINKFILIRSFKSTFNTTPNAYQLQLKADYGKELLSGSGDLADIALRAGFYDQAHFTREFKKAYGITPLRYYKDIHVLGQYRTICK